MTIHNIEQALQKMFDRGRTARLVFWYDEKQELREQFDEVTLEGVEKVVVDNNEFGLKYMMLREKPRQKFLIYRNHRPKDIDNWLLDLELIYPHFKTDMTSQWADELGLGLEGIPLIDQHKEFFVSKERREAFGKHLSVANTHDGDIKRKIMLAVCTHSKLARIDSVLESLLEDLSKDKEESQRLIHRTALDKFLWEQTNLYYHYKTQDPNIKDFIIKVFDSAFNHELGKPAELKQSVIGFLNRWKDNRHNSEAFEILSNEYASHLNIDTKIEHLNYKDLLEIDYFEVIDKKILSNLRDDVVSQKISASECSNIVKHRRRKYWFHKYQYAYEAIDYAAGFIHLLDNTNLTPQNIQDGIHRYVHEWYQLDYFYRKFIFSMRSFKAGDLLRQLGEWIEQLYSNRYLLTLCDNWQKHIDNLEKWDFGGIKSQKNFFDNFVKKPYLDKDKKVYVIISDAFRYEIGKELITRIQKEDRYDGTIEPVIASLPSYTQLGMASLLPNENICFSDDKSGSVIVDDTSSMGTENRNKILKKTGKAGTAIQSKEFIKMDRDESRTLLKDNNFLYIYHNHIDFVGDKRDSEERVFEAAETTLGEIIDIIKKLTNANATNIIVTADHGFLFQNKPLDESDYLNAAPEGDIYYHDRRFVLGKNLKPNNAFKKLTSHNLGLSGDMEVLLPKSINRLRKQGSGSRFVHGGATLQEIVTPVIHINKKRQSDVSRIDVEILQGSTNNITSGQYSIMLYQSAPISEKVLSRTLRVGIWAMDNELISDSPEITFDSCSENPREREMKIRFILLKKADDYNNQEVFLKLQEKISGTTRYQDYKTAQFIIKRSFTTDFDF